LFCVEYADNVTNVFDNKLKPSKKVRMTEAALNTSEIASATMFLDEAGPDCFTNTNRTSCAHSLPVVVVMCVAAGICSLLTVGGNSIVILSFIINKSLRNFSNYMILSLAVSDFTIGIFSMNVFITYNVKDSWTLGMAMCKAWLTVDYTASNASVMNLLVICLDR